MWHVSVMSPFEAVAEPNRRRLLELLRGGERAAGDLVEQAPVLYQMQGDARQTVAGSFVLSGADQVGFQVGAYDPSRTGVAPGMGVRFDKLTQDSQRVLERILNEKHRRGEAQLESRFDAGMRAQREARAQGHEFPETGTPLPA